MSRLEPELRDTRVVIVDVVKQYRADLPLPHPGYSQPGHPFLGQFRDRRIRFAGS